MRFYLALACLILATLTTASETAFYEDSEDGSGRIYRGNRTKDGEWKFMAYLQMDWPSKNSQILCGGVVWNEDHILTAGHCV